MTGRRLEWLARRMLMRFNLNGIDSDDSPSTRDWTQITIDLLAHIRAAAWNRSGGEDGIFQEETTAAVHRARKRPPASLIQSRDTRDTVAPEFLS